MDDMLDDNTMDTSRDGDTVAINVPEDLRARTVPPLHRGELWFGYLLRMAMANGMPDTMVFRQYMRPGEHDNHWRRYYLEPYDCLDDESYYGITVPGEDIRMLTSPLPARLPMMSRSTQHRYLAEYSRYRIRLFGHRPASTVPELKLCPECVKAHGDLVLYSWQQCPGVCVCHTHGCALLRYTGKPGKEFDQGTWRQMEVLPHAAEYATFAHDLWAAGLQCTAKDLVAAVEAGRSAFEISHGTPLETYMQAEYGPYGAVEGILNYKSARTLDWAAMTATLMAVYGSVDELGKVLESPAPDEAVEFVREIGDRFELLSSYRRDRVTLRCRRCGHEFLTSPHAIRVGWGCPAEDSRTGDATLLKRLFDTVSDGFVLLSPIKGLLGSIKVRDTRTGKVLSVKFERFLNNPHDYYLDHGGLSHNKLKAEVEAGGRYVLEDSERRGDQILLTMTDKVCGKTFKVYRNNFLINSECRCCEAPGSLTTDKYRAKVMEISTDYELEGDYHGYDNDVTVVHRPTGKKVTGKPYVVLMRLRVYAQRPEGLDGRMDRTEEKLLMEERFLSISDRVFYIDDFLDLSDRRYIRNKLSALAREGRLTRVEKGAYCATGLDYSPEDVIDGYFVRRGDAVLGWHIGDAFLRDLGMALPYGGVVDLVTTVKGDSHTMSYMVCGDIARVRRTDVDLAGLTDKAIDALQLLFFLMYKHLVSPDEGVVDEVLRHWARHKGLDILSVRAFKDRFPAAVSKAAERIVAEENV